MTTDIRHDRSAHRFTTEVEGTSAYLEYELSGPPQAPLMTITHTIVPSAIGGRGVAGELMRSALDTARGEGWKVRPACSYADAWMRRHPDYADLRA